MGRRSQTSKDHLVFNLLTRRRDVEHRRCRNLCAR